MKLPPADQIIYSEVMMPHELAHQWFGDEVSWASYHEQWLMEGAGELLLPDAAGAHSPRRRAVDAARLSKLAGVASRRKAAANVEAGPVTLGVRLSSSHFPNGYEIITYGRGPG